MKPSTQDIGPSKGTLLLAGGGERIDSILKIFIELAGGPEALIVVIPTAEGKEEDDINSLDADWFRKLSCVNVKVMHTNDRETANTEYFNTPLKTAKAVWFSGGRQWRLADAYKNTLTEKLLLDLLDRNGVIGGTSAGATIQGSFLTRGDTKNNQIMIGDHQEGFGFLKNTAIDQHVIARNRQYDMLEIIHSFPQLLGIGIDENTAIIVKQNKFEVIGESYVIIYDGKYWSRENGYADVPKYNVPRFYFLQKGDRYDLGTRRILD